MYIPPPPTTSPPTVAYPTDTTDTDTVAYLRAHISACRALDDYDPFRFQQWWQQQQQQGGGSAAGGGDPAPANCRQVGPPLPDGTLPLASIACDTVPLVRKEAEWAMVGEGRGGIARPTKSSQ